MVNQAPFDVESQSLPANTRRRIKYEHLFWFIFTVPTILVIIDRFLWNPWPLGVDRPPLEGPPSVIFFDVVLRATGRLALMTTNAMFWTVCYTYNNWFANHAPAWLDVGDIRRANIRIHRLMGWFLVGPPILVHVWVFIVPLLDGKDLIFIDKRPSYLGFYEDGAVNLATDDVYRLVLMTFLFFIVFPISIAGCSLRKRFNFSIILHLIGAWLYTLDLVRKSSHPHSHVFNTPFLFMWIMDRIIGYYFYRAHEAKVVKIIELDEDYLVAFLSVDHKHHQSFGDVYYMNFPPGKGSRFEISHPFTTWRNHARMKIPEEVIDTDDHRHKFPLMESDHHGKNQELFLRQDSDDSIALDRVFRFQKDGDDSTWNLAALVKVHRHPQTECCSRGTWTEKLQQLSDVPTLKTWGPYVSEYSRLQRPDLPPLIMIGCGCGASMILDFYLYIRANGIKLQNSVQVLLLCRSLKLFQFVTDLICAEEIENYSVHACYTSHDGEVIYEPKNGEKKRDMEVGRASFERMLSNATPNTEVYYCGSEMLSDEVQAICEQKKLIFIHGYATNVDDSKYCCI